MKKVNLFFLKIFLVLLLGIPLLLYLFWGASGSAIATTPKLIADTHIRRLKNAGDLLLDYMQTTSPDTQELSPGDAQKVLDHVSSNSEEYLWFSRDKKKYTFHANKEAWWIGFDIAELHSMYNPLTITPGLPPAKNFIEKLERFFKHRPSTHWLDIREGFVSAIEPHKQFFLLPKEKVEAEAARHQTYKIIGTDSLDNPPLSDDLSGLFKYDDNVIWKRIK